MAAEKPLKILVLDGGGLQAISTLLILNDLLQKIADRNGVPDRKPKPCEVFDTIAGIGAGGWLAILLGRFRMDVLAALTEWYNLMGTITPRSRTKAARMRLFRKSYFDQDSLVSQMNSLTQIYGTGENLFEKNPHGARTRHVLVAALRSDGETYNLFRSYPIPAYAKSPEKLLKGAEHPESFKISSAFGVTGAARYFSPVWKEHIAHTGKIRFSDTKFPQPHNITELVLNEMWSIYGIERQISVIVNIGPGRPKEHDIERIVRRFSWGKHSSEISTNVSETSKPGTDSARSNEIPSRSHKTSGEEKSRKPSIRFQGDAPPVANNTKTSTFTPQISPGVPRIDTFGSIKDRSQGDKLKRLEEEIERNIRGKLKHVYDNSPKIYFRLALDQAPEGTPQNDSNSSLIVMKATKVYLSESSSESTISQVVERIPPEDGTDY